MDQIAGNNFSLGTAAERIFGRFGDPIIRGIMVISLLSCINAVQLFCSRILYAMSADGLFFRYFARVNKGGTPELALLLSTIAGVLFVLGSFERVIAMLSFFFVANYTLSYTSLFILRRKEPQMPRPYRAWGYPWTTGHRPARLHFIFSRLHPHRSPERPPRPRHAHPQLPRLPHPKMGRRPHLTPFC